MGLQDPFWSITFYKNPINLKKKIMQIYMSMILSNLDSPI